MDNVFFDPNNPQDVRLLHASVRGHEEMKTVSYQIEWEVIDFYTQRENLRYRYGNRRPVTGVENLRDRQEIRVMLIDYDQNEPEKSPDELKEALRRTIADIVSWVLRNYDNTQDAQSIRQGDRSISFATTIPNWRNFPNGWNRRMKNWDFRVAGYSI